MAAQPQVNLVARRKQELVRERRMYAKVQFIALAMVVGYVGLLVFVLMVKGVLVVSQNKLESSIQDQELALAKLRPVEEIYMVLMNKLSLAQDYLQNRSLIEEDIRTLHDSLPEGVTFDSLLVGENETTMTIDLVAHDMYRLIDYMHQTEAVVADDQYGQVTLSSITRTGNGQYSMGGVYYLNRN